jgi:hypothetical protein
MKPLPWAGYQKLRPGRIHILCQRCGRKQSNAPLWETDPPQATLVRSLCDNCDSGCKDCGQEFFDDRGRRLCSFCGRWQCERAMGTLECTEEMKPEEPTTSARG